MDHEVITALSDGILETMQEIQKDLQNLSADQAETKELAEVGLYAKWIVKIWDLWIHWLLRIVMQVQSIALH